MKHIQSYWGILLASTILVFRGCHKGVYEPGALEKNYFIQNIPEGFNWSSVKNVNIQITPDDQYNGQYPYKIEIFNHNPALSDSIIRYAAGWCIAQNPLKQEMTVRSTDSVFFIRQTTPGGNRSVNMASSVNNRLTVSFAPQNIVDSKVTPYIRTRARDAFQIPTTIPANAQPITTSTQLISGNYYIDNTFSGNIQFPSSDNCNLYILGKWKATAKNYTLENQTNIYILPGGKLIPEVKELTFTINTENTFTIAEGAQLGNKDTDITFKFNKGAIYNDGNFFADDIIFDGATPKIVNNGVFSADDIKIENPGEISNEENGNFKVNELNMNGGLLSNKGTLFIEDLKTVNKIIIENFDNAVFIGENIELTAGGTLINQCYLKFKEIDLKRSYLKLASGSSAKCEELKSSDSTISLNPNALLNITEEIDIKNEGITYFKGFGNSRSLIKASEIKGNNGWKTILFSGNLCVEYTKIPQDDTYRTEQGVTLYSTSKDEYAPIEINPGKCTGDHHHPHPDDIPVTPVFPQDETFPQMYTYTSKDNYPSPEDYDMNDPVLSIDSITYTYLNAN